MYLVFDIGGTKMRLASSFNGENLQDVKIVQTPTLFEEAFDILKDFIGKSSDLSHDENLICMGLPGVFDKGKETLIAAPNLPDWITKPIKEKLEEYSGSKVYLENDASLAALGEAVKGEGKGFQIVAYIAVGTGVGGSRIVNGKIDVSRFGLEPGHQIINADVVVGGRMVDFEGVVSGIGIQTRYGKKAEEIKDKETWDEIQKFLAIGLTNTILHWSPDVLILGGGLMQSEFISIDTIQKYISEVLKVFPKIPEIKRGVLGDEAGLLGGLEYLKGLQ